MFFDKKTKMPDKKDALREALGPTRRLKAVNG